MTNMLAGFVQGLGAAQMQNDMRSRNALSSAMQAGDMTGARNAFISLDPAAAYQQMQPDPEARRKAALGLVQGVQAVPEAMRPQAWAAALGQAQQFGMDVSGVPQEYPGPEYVDLMGGMLGMPMQEATEFERLISVLGPDQARQALMVRLGLAPGADAQLRVGAQSQERDPIAALRARATEAGLRPGTPEYAQFMVSGGSQSGLAVDVDPASGGVSIRQGAGAGSAPQKPFSEGQSKDVVYATRARGALAVLDPIAGSLTSLGQRAAGLDPTGVVRGAVQSDEYQIARNAADEFLQAVLRKDTGAAITSQEQDLYGVTYLPQPGDNEAVLAAKAQARRRAIAAIEAGMSPAQIIAQERGLRASGSQGRSDPPPGVDPGDWEFMSPEDRALFE